MMYTYGDLEMKKRKIRDRKITWNTLPERIKKVRAKILSAGNTIGAVEFIKRTDDQTRRMSFRLHVQSPSFVTRPKKSNNKFKDLENLQLTVYDVNKVNRDYRGKIIGRGAYRTIPLENVMRISVKGTVYRVEKVKRRKASEEQLQLT